MLKLNPVALTASRRFSLPEFNQTVICLLLSLGILLCGCAGLNPRPKDDPEPVYPLETGEIHGKITDFAGLSLADCLIEADNRQARTDSAGLYRLAGIRAGDHRVTARGVGLEPKVREGVRVFPGRITENIDFVLTPRDE